MILGMVITVPKIIIEVEYEPNLKYYPDSIKTTTEAMLFDVDQIEKGHGDIGLILENDLKIVGVQDDSGVIHRVT